MSFKGMGKSTQKRESADPKTGAPSHLLDEFPADYSLAGRSPAEPASASPTEAKYATVVWRQSMTFLRAAYSLTKIIGSESTLRTLFFCPADGVHLSGSLLVVKASQAFHFHVQSKNQKQESKVRNRIHS